MCNKYILDLFYKKFSVFCIFVSSFTGILCISITSFIGAFCIGDLTCLNNLGNQTLNDVTDTYYSDNYLDNYLDNNLLFFNKTIINEKINIKLLTKDSLIDETSKNYNNIFNWNILSEYILYRKNNNCTNNLKVIIF